MNAPAMDAWANARSILCIRLDSLGDILMTTPAIRALKDSQPGRKITLLTSPAGAAVAPMVPEIDATLVYEAPWMKSTPPRPDSRTEARTIARLRQGGFDAAVIFTVFSQNPLPAAMLAYLADIPLRLAHCRENPYQLLTHWVKETDLEAGAGMRHEVRRQLDLVAQVGAVTENERLSLQAPAAACQAAGNRLEALGIDRNRPWVVIHPGASAPSRRYPPESYARVAALLACEQGWQVVFTGGAEEASLVETIRQAAGAPSVSLAGQLSLPEMAGLLSLAPLLVSNNTGPAHMAAALGTPVVDLYALTNPQHTPWGVPCRVLFHDVPCKYCFKSVCPLGHQNCLRLLDPEMVVEAALELVNREGG